MTLALKCFILNTEAHKLFLGTFPFKWNVTVQTYPFTRITLKTASFPALPMFTRALYGAAAICLIIGCLQLHCKPIPTQLYKLVMCCLLPILVAYERRKSVNILAAPQDPHQIPSSSPSPPAEALVSSTTARRAKRDKIPPMERQSSLLKEASEQRRTKLRDCIYICGGSYITRLRTRWNGLAARPVCT